MNRTLRKKSNFWIGLYFISILLLFATLFSEHASPILSGTLLLVGTISFFPGIWFYVRSKGYSGWYTVLVAFPSVLVVIVQHFSGADLPRVSRVPMLSEAPAAAAFIGLLLVYVLPDRCKGSNVSAP